MSKQSLGKSNLLFIASHALSLYADEGGELTVSAIQNGLTVVLIGIDSRTESLHPAFAELIDRDAQRNGLHGPANEHDN